MANELSKNKNLPVRKTMCGSCPFRPGSKTAFLREDLEESSHSTTRICHSTGSNNVFHARTGFPSHICRGSRDVQLDLMVAMGVLTEPTDEAWNKAREKVGLPPQIVQNPKPSKPCPRKENLFVFEVKG